MSGTGLSIDGAGNVQQTQPGYSGFGHTLSLSGPPTPPPVDWAAIELAQAEQNKIAGGPDDEAYVADMTFAGKHLPADERARYNAVFDSGDARASARAMSEIRYLRHEHERKHIEATRRSAGGFANPFEHKQALERRDRGELSQADFDAKLMATDDAVIRNTI